ncbi:MAG: hypothetical protein Ta2B_22360 [Termitinemataceae bacterium]|nr:MAG: hypothetical protein Ta2B_22360 [Termitinemataceae bacterium]
MQNATVKKVKHSVEPRSIGSKSSEHYMFREPADERAAADMSKSSEHYMFKEPQHRAEEYLAQRYPNYKTKHWTYGEFLQIDLGGSVFTEIINGELYIMPSPSIVHQAISAELFFQLYSFCRGTSIKTFASPIDVRLFPKADETDDTVVVPDIAVMCNLAKFSEKSFDGSPDMVVEILSPSNKERDQVVKYELYKKSCVKEYWIVDPKSETVSVFILENGEYVKTLYKKNDTINVNVFVDVCSPQGGGQKGLSIHLADVFK